MSKATFLQGNAGRAAALFVALMCALPLVYFFHSRVLVNTQRSGIRAERSLKKPGKGPVRWNPFQSKDAQKPYEMMVGFDNTDLPPITLIDTEELRDILDDLRDRGRRDSQYVVIDVRSEDEIERTGPFAPEVNHMPIHCVTMRKAFAMGDEEFLSAFGFEKPTMEETVVFTCKTGRSSLMAAEMAAIEGYNNLLNYMGGANEWFENE